MKFASLLSGCLLLTSCFSGNSGYFYTEQSSLTVIEAEHWTQTGRVDGLSWKSILDTDSDGSAVKLSGTGAQIPGLSYDVTYAESGTRFLWLRGKQRNPASGVDIRLTTDDSPYDPGNAQFTATWQWQRAATLSVQAEQTIRTTILARDTSVLLEKLLFTSDETFVPTGTNPSIDGGTTVIVVGTDSLEVHAGADTQVTQPGLLNLRASIDHRSSDGAEPALQWSMLSGPANALFSDPASARTSVEFPLAGDYTLRINASAGQLQSADDIAVKVLPVANQAPVATIANANDLTVALNKSLALTAEATDDGLPGNVLYYWWSAISGPGETFFGSQNRATTSASFNQQGSYQLQLNVQDGALSTQLTAQVSVTAAVDPDPIHGHDSAAGADFFVLTAAPLDSSSTYTSGSFKLANKSKTALISSVKIDLSTAAIGDIVFDPLGTAGDSAYKNLTIDSGALATGYASRQFSADNAGGYDALQMVFNDFQPGEEITFSIDLDPANVRGVKPPGDRHAASISGFEIAGASVSVNYADGSSQSGKLFGSESSETASQIQLRPRMPAPPTISLVGIADRSFLNQDQQTVRISGQPSQRVRLFVSEAGLYLAGTPGGGYDVDPFEPNTIIVVQQHLLTLDSNGLAEHVVQMPRSNPDAGFYIVQAASVESNLVGSASQAILLRRN